MNINAGVRISNGTTINVDLSTDGKNKVSIQGDGSLEYSMSPMNSNGRLTGRFNINGGFARYTPPFMSEKLFTFSEGSYVAFNGDMLNPTLNIHAVDQIKANVTQEGQNSRLVNFDVSLSVTNTLANMNVAFDLSTDDDITVENELSAMSPEQRANQAMNMLLYNVYTGPGTRKCFARRKSALFVPLIDTKFVGSQKHQGRRHIIRHRPIRQDHERQHGIDHKLQLQSVEIAVQRPIQDNSGRQLLDRRQCRRELLAKPDKRHFV